MNRPESMIHITAPNPDGRKKEMLVVACRTPEDVQTKVAELGIDVDQMHIFSGFELRVQKEVVVKVSSEPRPRRGRPPGSKNKRKRKMKAKANGVAKAGTSPGSRGASRGDDIKSLLKKPRKGAKRAKSDAANGTAPGSRNGTAPGSRVALKKGKRSGESQADRNARVEASA